MKKNVLTKALSLLLALTLLTGLFPAGVLAAGVPETLVTSLTELYSGDETRAREDLEALSAAGLLDGDGRLVALDIIEDGESVELSALAERIMSGEEVGEITVNGNAATSEQIMQISQVKAAIEIAELLDEEIDVTDEHVENLESLLTGIQDGSVDLNDAIKTGNLKLNANQDMRLFSDGDSDNLPATSTGSGNVEATEGKYTAPYLSGEEYEDSHSFTLADPNNTTWYTESTAVSNDAVVTMSCASTVNANSTFTVTATLNEAQSVPVSFDWTAGGALDLDPTGETSGTVTWEANDETLTKTFQIKTGAKSGIWVGTQCLVINAGNIKNATFADGKTVWSRTVSQSANDSSAVFDSYPGSVNNLDMSKFTDVNANWRYADYADTKNLFPTVTTNFRIILTYGINDKYPNQINYTIYLLPANATVAFDQYNDLSVEGDAWSARAHYIDRTKGSGEIILTPSDFKFNNAPSSINSFIEQGILSSAGTKIYVDKVYNPLNALKVSIANPPTSVKAESVSVPAGTYYTGQVVPVTVTLEQCAIVNSDTKLKVNGVDCTPLNSGTEGKTFTFGYTVRDVDTAAINVTELTGLKNTNGDAVSINGAFPGGSFGADKDVTLISNVKTSGIDWDNVKYGIDDAGAGEQTVTVLLPFKSDVAKDWVANDAVTINPALTMSFPNYENASVRGYLKSTYFSADGGTTRYPVYVIGDNADALAVRFVPPLNPTAYLRKDTLSLYLDIDTGSTTNYLGEWDAKKTDAKGFAYFEAPANEAPAVADRSYSYYVKGGIAFEPEKTMDRAGYDAAKVTSDGFYQDGVNYVVKQGGESSKQFAQQYDVELVANKALYDAVSQGVRAEDPNKLTLSYQCSNRKNFTFTTPEYFSWSTSDSTIATVVKDEKTGAGEIVLTGGGGDVTVTLTVGNGSPTKKYDLSLTFKVLEGKTPFLNIPEFSKERTTLTGTGVDVLFASNVTARNAALNKTTTFTAKLYPVSAVNAEPTGNAVWTEDFASTTTETLTHITVPAQTVGTYAVVISTSYAGGVVDGMATAAKELSATVYLTVKQAPLKVTLDTRNSYAADYADLPITIGYTLDSPVEGATVQYTIQKSGEEVGQRQDASGGTISFTAAKPVGLKEAYTITVYGRNTENDPWSTDSLVLTVYNGDVLDLIVKDVAYGAIGGTTGGTGTGAKNTTVNMDNHGKLTNYGITGDNYKLTVSDLNALRTDLSLQKVISVNYGSGAWGLLSDKMQWSSGDSGKVSVNYEQGGIYSDIRNYSYTAYGPGTDFLLVGKDKTDADGVTIEVTHAATEKKASVTVKADTLEDQLYVFQFNPQVETDVIYTNGANQERKLKSDGSGVLAVYEPQGILGDVRVMSEKDGDTYIGTIYNRDLRSGERDIAALQLYPCNNFSLRKISDCTLTFLTPDGKPFVGSVTLRGGAYTGGDYCPDAYIYTEKSHTNKYLREDIQLTTDSNGKATVFFNPTEFFPADSTIWSGVLNYVFEYRFEDSYQPGYVVLDVAVDEPADSIVNLKAVRGSATAPQITRQEYQQYLNGTKPTDYIRNVIDYKENIGISPDFSKAFLYTDIALPGESVEPDGNGYSTYAGENVVKFALCTTGGTTLTGQTELSGENQATTQITNLSQLNSAAYFVFPFSSFPMLRSVYTMTNENMTKDGITDEGANPTPTARVKAVFTRGDLTVASINLPFGVTNVSHQPGMNSPKGAAGVGKEVRDTLQKQTDIGEIFRSINVNDMIRKGFVFLGNLGGMGGDNVINLMILPTADPATFRIIAFVGANQRQDYTDTDEEGVSVNFNADDLAEDMNKFQEEIDRIGKDDDDDDDSSGQGSLKFNFYGTVILEARVGVADGKWNIAFRGGNVGTNVKGKYEWGQNFMCGPVPAFISFEVGFHADLEVAFGNKSAARAMLLDAALGVSIEAFAGLGFDLSLVALQLGIYGKIGADVDFLLLTPSDQSAKTGTKLTISGEIGIKLKVKVLFISYSEKFASTGFDWTKKWNNYDKIQQYWNEEKGYGELFGLTSSGRAYRMYLFNDGSTIVKIDGGAELESRDYLELAERSWTGGANSGMRLLRSAGDVTDAITNVQTNSYPYSHPAFTDDGEMFLYISDNDNAKKLESVASYAVKDGDGYLNMGPVDTSEGNILADLDVVASGTADHAFAAWVKQLEAPEKEMHDKATYDDLGMMFNATEIYAGSYSGSGEKAKWNTTRLTTNSVADMSPTVASYGNKAIVAWRSINASSMPKEGTNPQDLTAMFDVENNINYRVYDGTEWKSAQVAYNGSAGTVNAIDSAMLSDGTAILVYTVRTAKDDVTSTETFYTVINASGTIVTTGRLTNDSYTDTNAQVTAVNDTNATSEKNDGYFVLGWYSEHDAGEGNTVEYELGTDGKPVYDENGKAKVKETKAVVAHDIRLARINANGSYDIDFPESIGGTGETGISPDFNFSAPVNNTDLTNVSVVWSQRKDSDKAEDAGKYELNAVRFFKADGVTGLTAPTDIAETDKNYTIDRFDTYTDNDGAIHAIILGSDYNQIQGISVYDSIDLNAAADNTVTSNSDSPNNLNILDGEAISSLKLAKGTFPETAADVTADINISEVMPGYTTPVQFTVSNTGTSVLDAVTATVGTQSKGFTGLNLLPNQSTTLLMSYSVPENKVEDVDYTVKSGGTELGSGTLNLNRPDVGISGIKLLQEHDGVREIQVMLANSAEIPLAGSGKTVKLAFYKDPFHENVIKDSEVSIPTTAFADIDAGTYTTVQTLNVTDIVTLNADGEIPEDGVTVYAHVWIEEPEKDEDSNPVISDEPNTYNNDNYISFTGLLTRNNGEKLTTDTTLEVGDGSYTVYADVRNNSMKDNNIGTPVALLKDADGNVIAQQNFQESSLTLTKEHTNILSATFAAENLGGKTPAQATLGTIYTVTFDVNGGSSNPAIEPVRTDLEGHITLPTTTPTKTVETGADPLFFAGWYTAAEGGERITENYTFTSDTTVYAHYVNHQHDFTYSAEGTAITATCGNTDGHCYLPSDETTQARTATLTIAAPDSTTYTGTAIAAKITDNNAIQGSAKVLYATKGEGGTYGDASETVPVNVGSYQASITLGEGDGAKTVSVEYEIENAALTNVDQVAQNGTLTYTGEAQTPQVAKAATAVNNQTITYTYSKTQDGPYGEMPTFTNVADSGTVYFKLSAPNHNDATGSFTVTVNKANQTAPAAPTMKNASASSITLNVTEGCEYSKDGTNWQDSATFTGLTKETTYTFYQRLKGTNNYNASSSSASASFTTTAHDHNWGSFTASGATITAICANTDTFHPTTESLTNTMVINAPALTTYGGDGSASATVTNGLGGIAVPAIVYKKGNDDLDAAPTDAGTYTASITLTGVNTGANTTGDVTATVEYTIAKATPAAPTGVTATRTATIITVNTPAQTEPAKYEYSIDNGTNWQDSAEFTGLTPATTYQVVVREKETANYNAGTPSEALAVTTLPVITMTGTARYGRTLTVAEGYSYQWYRVDKTSNPESVTPIADATEHTYIINNAEDIGKTLRVKVTSAGTDKVNEGVITADSAVVEVGLYTAPVLSVSKTTVTENTIKIDGFENYRADGKYQYSVDGGDPVEISSIPFTISGLTNNTTYSIVVQGVEVKDKSGATTVIAKGTPSVPLTVKTPAKVVPLTGVSINGTAQVGNTLSAKPEPADATSLTYQWYRGNNAIESATYSTYALTKDDYNQQIKVVTTQSGSSKTSDAVQVGNAPAVTVANNSIRATATNTSITVTAPRSTATRNYEYSLDNENWQTDNTFTFAPASEEAEKTVYVRTGGEGWQVTGTEIGQTTVSVPGKPYPFDTAPTVIAKNYQYKAYSETENQPSLSIGLAGSAAPVFQYRIGTAGTWQNWTSEAANSLSVGSHYYMRAEIAGNETYHAYTTEPVTFAVTQNTTVTREAPAAPTVSNDSLIVTIAKADRGKALEYQVDGTTGQWASVPTLNSDGQFTLGALSAASHKVNLRYRADSNYQNPSDSVASANFTLSQYSVAYDANGGSGAPAPQTATSPATITVYAKDDKANSPTRSGYTFDGWFDGNSDVSGQPVSAAKTLKAKWTANKYTIAFNANGGTGTMESISNVAYDAVQKLTTNTFTRSGYTFAGWATSAGGSVLYNDGQKVKNLTATQNGTVTLYAVWVADGKSVSGNVESGYPGTVELKLMRGSTQVGGTQVVSLTLGTDGKYTGTYNFTGIPNGTYNLVAMQIVARTDATGGEYEEALVRTAAVTVSDNSVSIGSDSSGKIVMPGGDASSEVAVKDDTPPVVVDGLDAEAERNSITDRSVSFTMTVESTNKSADGLGAESADAMNAIESQNSIGAAEELSYLNIGIEKEVLKDGTVESKETVTETEKVITICIPYDMTGKQAYQIMFYRHHIDAQGIASTAPLTRDSARSIGSEKDGHFYVDQTSNMIYLYTNQFSTYAIGYNPDAAKPATSNDSGHSGHSGGSGGAIVYTPDINTPQHGKVSVDPKSASTGNLVTITAEPDEGYAVDTVTVTNQSGDKVRVTKVNETTYTFLQPAGKVKIDVSFKEAGAPATTGPVTAPQPDVFDAFTDLDKGAWYRDGVKYVLENGIMNGMGDGIFAPNGTTSRAMIVTMLWRMEGGPVVNYAMRYTDVDADAWYAEAVRWAASEGIVTGYSETAFGPNDNVTREQLATILYRYAQSKGEGFKGAWMFLLDFPDAADVSAWADEAMHWMVMKEIITGMGDGTLNPGGEATRAQVATMLMRYHALTTAA